jgi:hypothetical protein
MRAAVLLLVVTAGCGTENVNAWLGKWQATGTYQQTVGVSEDSLSAIDVSHFGPLSSYLCPPLVFDVDDDSATLRAGECTFTNVQGRLGTQHWADGMARRLSDIELTLHVVYDDNFPVDETLTR